MFRIVRISPAITGLPAFLSGAALAALVSGAVSIGPLVDVAHAAQLRQVTERVFPFEPGGELAIESQNGRITVEAWNRPEARIQITRDVRASDDKRAEALMKELRADVELSSGRISIVSRYPKRDEKIGLWDVLGNRVTSLNIHYYIQVPARTRLHLVTSNGDLQIRGTKAGVVGQTVNGAIDIRSTGGAIEVSTTNGAIRLQGVETPARAGTTNGAVSADIARVGAGNLELVTTNGDLTVTLPSNLQATLDAETTNGRVHVGFPVTRSGVASSRSARGRIGGGGAVLTLRTTNGNIHIRKQSSGKRT